MRARAIALWLVTVILPLALVLPSSLSAQGAEEDVVYLKDGSVVRGTIVEQKPGERLSIRTRDGNVFRYQMSQIDRMTREPVYGVKARGNEGTRSWKDPGTATLLSVLVSGGGQLYSGETNRGLIILGVGLGSLVLGTAMYSCDYSDASCSSAPVLLGVLGYLGSWLYGVIDADDSAHRMNEKRGLGMTTNGRLQPTVGTLPSRSVGVGFRVVAP